MKRAPIVPGSVVPRAAWIFETQGPLALPGVVQLALVPQKQPVNTGEFLAQPEVRMQDSMSSPAITCAGVEVPPLKPIAAEMFSSELPSFEPEASS